jgi:hypothetical protein
MICSARSSAASVSESNSRSAVLSKILNRAALAACALTLASPGIALGQTVPVSRADLCVTEGAIDESGGALLSVDSAKMRAYLNNATRQFVEARFTYLGPTATSARLGSGELRSQFGLKLRAADACNLIYAMWRFEPESKLVVSVKANPSEHSSAECGNRGYRNVKPRRFSKFPPAEPGQTRTLRAELDGEQMRVFIDQSLVWEGPMGADVRGMEGPVGIRSDNARLIIALKAGESLGVAPPQRPMCRSGAESLE